MGQTKPVWLVALQSAAEGMMGNEMLTREQFEASIRATLAEIEGTPEYGEREKDRARLRALVAKNQAREIES